MDQADVLSVAISARKRHYGLSSKDATSVFAGSLIGRLKLNDLLDAAEFDSACWLLECYNRNAWAIGSPAYVHQAPEGSGAGANCEDARTVLAHKVIRRWEKITSLLNQFCLNSGRNILAAVLAAVLEDRLLEASEQGVRDVREGLQCLTRLRRGQVRLSA
ncbi:hypothetical protein [Pseudovibrio brasiliensis]|uniref:Uncharacterized protein n=1 Tax=Pseudovibrio brasiliensis TaxID=1898042 RepID=A0ABX8AVW0_9HYPH|nr:hypothetical protein [Pseudovibrio brasiliensis]QUS59197.1 hypothetical protein KGB56_27005 [Pseudovibrio brasiliensis]